MFFKRIFSKNNQKIIKKCFSTKKIQKEFLKQLQIELNEIKVTFLIP